METPTNFGWFHLMFIGIAILLTVLLCIKFKDCDDKTFRRIALIGWILILILEIYKQLSFSFSVDGSYGAWDYQWYAFPFQFCSSPLYVLPFIIFTNEGKVRDAFISYMSTFSLFAGLAVFVYPNDVFISTIGINIQTMIHHGLQIVFGIYFAVYARRKLSIRNYAKSIPVFMGFSLIAILLDVIVYKVFVLKEITETFNMFFISPYFPCTLPILSVIYEKVHYSVFLCMYLIGFTLVSALVYFIEKAIFIAFSKTKRYVK